MRRRPPARVITTDAEIDAAIAAGKKATSSRPRAVSAEYRAKTDTVVVTLATGVQIHFPRLLLQGLQDASPAQLRDVIVEGYGSGLHWGALDVDHYVPGLIEGELGTRKWMETIGRSGGEATTAAKAAASRSNGRKGGRPKKKTAA